MSLSLNKPSKISSARRLLSFIKPESKIFSFAMVGLVLGMAINLIFPEVIRRLLNEDFRYYLSENPWSTAACLVALFFVQAISFYVRSLLFGMMGQRIVNTIRKKVFNSLVAQDVGFFDRSKAGDLVSRLSSDTLMIQDAVAVKLSVFIRYSLQVIGGLVLMMLISLRLTCLIVFCVPLMVLTSRSLAKKLRYWSKEQQRQLALSSSLANESFSNARIVKAFNQEQFEQNRYAEMMNKVLEAGMKRTAIAAFFSSFISFLLNATLVYLMFYGFQRVGQGHISVGDFTAFILYGVIVAVSFAFVANGLTEFMQALGASERIFDFLDMPVPAPPANNRASMPDIHGSVEFKNVSFAYPSRDQVNVLQDISFSIDHGKVTAIVGPSGAGKSTIVNLLMKFYRPSSGKIFINQVELDKIDDYQLRSTFAYVPQDPQLFAMSIAENIRYARAGASLEEIRSACASANILEFIESLPQGFDTESGERGIQLSSGQKQRIAIARALLRNPQLLILDEATSALDSENEFLVRQALETLMRNRTTLVIAHRLATVKNADKVLVLQDGRLIQSGTHDSLVEQSGVYRQLVEKQELVASAAN